MQIQQLENSDAITGVSNSPLSDCPADIPTQISLLLNNVILGPLNNHNTAIIAENRGITSSDSLIRRLIAVKLKLQLLLAGQLPEILTFISPETS